MAGFKNKKTIPQFIRPATSADTVDRVWKDVFPTELSIGDIIPGIGVLVDIIAKSDCSGQVWLEAGIPESKDYFLDSAVLVKAFVKKG